MLSPTGMVIAAITVMLWILWSDTLRQRRPSPLLYTIRIALYLVMCGILVLNAFRYPHLFGRGDRALVAVAVVIGIIGAAYFGRRLVRRT